MDVDAISWRHSFGSRFHSLRSPDQPKRWLPRRTRDSLLSPLGYQRASLAVVTTAQSAIRPKALDRANVPGQVTADAAGEKAEDE
jgi:hypothetical protein